METSAKLYSLSFSNVKTYLFAFLFVAGNIALPQLCHLVPMGGPTLLPIYFFTLIAAYKFGFRVGLSPTPSVLLRPLLHPPPLSFRRTDALSHTLQFPVPHRNEAVFRFW